MQAKGTTMTEYALVINGEKVVTRETFDVINPATGEVFAACPKPVRSSWMMRLPLPGTPCPPGRHWPMKNGWNTSSRLQGLLKKICRNSPG